MSPVEEFEDLSENHQRLEAMLAELGDDGMLLGELDGYLCGVAVAPEPIDPADWMPLVWGGEQFDVPAVDQAELTAMVMARYDEIVAELAEARYEPLYEVDGPDDDVIWEVWVAGFESAMSLQIASWQKLLKSHKESRAQEAAFAITSLLAASDPEMDEKEARDPELLEFRRQAPTMIPEIAIELYRAHRLSRQQAPLRSIAVGRNDPCPCGSGLKYKRCHGAT
jgi:uncharacterized protein